MAEKKEGRLVIPEDELRARVMQGAKKAYDAVSVTYGPKGKNVIVERGFGRPTYTRDGVTIVEQVFSSDRVENIGMQALAEASRAANNISGDGSTVTSVLTYHLLENGVKAIAAGHHPMDVSDIIIKDSHVLLEALKSEVIPVKDENLKDVATVSAGDALIGQLIADAILYVGPDGGILTEKAPIAEIEREYVDGYYLQSGFTALQAGKKELIDPFIIVSAKRLTSSADAIELLNKTVEAKFVKQGQIPRIVFIGNIEDQAYTTIVNTVNAGQIDAVIIKTPPMYGELGKYLLDDIALYTGCDLITETTSLKQFNANYIGTVDKVVASKSDATLFGDNKSEAVITRITEIKDQLAAEETPAIAEKLRDRVAKLEGKIAIFKIGGATDSTREETEFRIEDAINSTRHAYAEGIVPGGGVTLLELSKLADNKELKLTAVEENMLEHAMEEGLSKSFKSEGKLINVPAITNITCNALRSTFKKLLSNAYPNKAELLLDKALNARKGHGYNLKESAELVDVLKAGIADPYVVVREAITHATGMAAETIKTGLALVFEDMEK